MSKFKKGISGNPSGRPPGITDKRCRFSKLLQPHAEALIAKAIELAMNGEVAALKICLAHILPRARNELTPFPLPTNEAKNVQELLNNNTAIITAVSDGLLTLEEARAFSELLEIQRDFIISSELEQRLAAIEQILIQRQKNEDK